MNRFKILSIDAWCDCMGCECTEDNPTCWQWNDWCTIGHARKIPVNLIEYLIKKGILTKYARLECEIIDDQYNIVVVEKKNQRPLIALEYGAHL